MDGQAIFAAAGFSLAVVLNVVGFAYTYGKITQTLTDVCRRVDHLERFIFNRRSSDG